MILFSSSLFSEVLGAALEHGNSVGGEEPFLAKGSLLALR